MTETELDQIMRMPAAAIIAPAGHGKTEMISEMVKRTEGKQLLLTHTNAGVDAIERRLQSEIFKKRSTVYLRLLLSAQSGVYHIATLENLIKLYLP